MNSFAHSLIQALADHPQSAAGRSPLLLVTGLSEIAGAMKGVGGRHRSLAEIKVTALTLTGQGSEAWKLVEHFPATRPQDKPGI